MDAPKPRHLFAVPEGATWFDTAVLSAASRITNTPDNRLSSVGRELKQRIAKVR